MMLEWVTFELRSERCESSLQNILEKSLPEKKEEQVKGVLK